MNDTIEERTCELAQYIIENGATVRTAAKHFGISKSTVHKDLSQRLPQYNQLLFRQVRAILDLNKALYSYKLTFDFTTDAGALSYLNGRSFRVETVDFVKEYFPDYKM